MDARENAPRACTFPYHTKETAVLAGPVQRSVLFAVSRRPVAGYLCQAAVLSASFISACADVTLLCKKKHRAKLLCSLALTVKCIFSLLKLFISILLSVDIEKKGAFISAPWPFHKLVLHQNLL